MIEISDNKELLFFQEVSKDFFFSIRDKGLRTVQVQIVRCHAHCNGVYQLHVCGPLFIRCGLQDFVFRKLRMMTSFADIQIKGTLSKKLKEHRVFFLNLYDNLI